MAAAPAPPEASQRGRSPRARSGGRRPGAAGSASASALRRWRRGARGAPRTILRPARRAPLRGGLRGAGGAAASGRVMSAAAPRRDRGGHGQWRGGAGAAARRQPMGGGMRRSGRAGPGRGRGVGGDCSPGSGYAGREAGPVRPALSPQREAAQRSICRAGGDGQDPAEGRSQRGAGDHLTPSRRLNPKVLRRPHLPGVTSAGDPRGPRRHLGQHLHTADPCNAVPRSRASAAALSLGGCRPEVRCGQPGLDRLAQWLCVPL